MYREKMKVIGAVVLGIALFLGVLTISTTNVAFAADQSSKPASQNPQLDGRVPGWCNWDGDQDKDDWCWTNATITTTVPSTNTYAAPGANGATLPAGAVFPYGAIIGQADPYQDAGYMSGYNNNYNNNFFYSRRVFRINRRFVGDGDGDADDVVQPRVFRGRRIFFGRNGLVIPIIPNNGRRVFYMP